MLLEYKPPAEVARRWADETKQTVQAILKEFESAPLLEFVGEPWKPGIARYKKVALDDALTRNGDHTHIETRWQSNPGLKAFRSRMLMARENHFRDACGTYRFKRRSQRRSKK